LCEQQIFVGVIAVAQARCEPVLQSSTGQWGMHLPKSGLQCIGCWVTAHLCEQQIFVGVIAVTQACCETVLQSSTGQCGMRFAKIRLAVLLWWITAHLYEQQIFIGVIAVTQACCEPVLQSSIGQCVATSNHHCPVLLCKTGCQQAYVSANTPMETCCSYNCAVTQHQCTATLFLATSNHHCPVLLCIQLCSVPTPVHCKQAHSLHSVTVFTPMQTCSSYKCAVRQHQCTAALLMAR